MSSRSRRPFRFCFISFLFKSNFFTCFRIMVAITISGGSNSPVVNWSPIHPVFGRLGFINFTPICIKFGWSSSLFIEIGHQFISFLDWFHSNFYDVHIGHQFISFLAWFLSILLQFTSNLVQILLFFIEICHKIIAFSDWFHSNFFMFDQSCLISLNWSPIYLFLDAVQFCVIGDQFFIMPHTNFNQFWSKFFSLIQFHWIGHQLIPIFSLVSSIQLQFLTDLVAFPIVLSNSVELVTDLSNLFCSKLTESTTKSSKWLKNWSRVSTNSPTNPNRLEIRAPKLEHWPPNLVELDEIGVRFEEETAGIRKLLRQPHGNKPISDQRSWSRDPAAPPLRRAPRMRTFVCLLTPCRLIDNTRRPHITLVKLITSSK